MPRAAGLCQKQRPLQCQPTQGAPQELGEEAAEAVAGGQPERREEGTAGRDWPVVSGERP
eukprot:scaffold53648_cov21-Prasinocladus_malaysianus.AAC.1